MQPHSREIQQPQMSLQDQQTANSFMNSHTSSHDDFLEQMYSSIGSSSSSSCPWYSDVMGTANPKLPPPWDFDSQKSLDLAVGESNLENVQQLQLHDQSVLLSTKFRQHQINDAAAAKSLLLSQQLPMQSKCVGGNEVMSSIGGPIAGEASLIHFPLDVLSAHHNNPSGNLSVQSLYNGFAGSLLGSGQTSNQFHKPQLPQGQDFGAAPAVMSAAAPSSSSAGGGQPRQRVRARRGQATDPHSIAERLRRERIAERMKALQELVPNGNKSDKASMLDEIIDYVKFLQLQVKLLSMSRLGGAVPVMPIAADISSEARGGGSSSNGGQHGALLSSSTNDSVTVTENQLAKLMEEDMGSAMQYLQGKGLCLMPISLATAISTATCHSRNPLAPPPAPSNGPLSPNNMSVLTVQSSFKNDVVHLG